MFHRRRNIPLASIQGFEITWLCFSTGHTLTHAHTKAHGTWHNVRRNGLRVCMHIYIQNVVHEPTRFAHGYVCTVHGVRLYFIIGCVFMYARTHTDYVIDEALKRFLPFFTLCLALNFSYCVVFPPSPFICASFIYTYLFVKAQPLFTNHSNSLLFGWW